MNHYKKLLKYSRIYFVKQLDVRWGDFSLVACEYVLLKEALKHGPYQYYHILSGVDLPLKTQDEIHKFFDKIDGQEVVQVVSRHEIEKREAYYRVSRYHFFTRHIKDPRKSVRFLLKAFNMIVMPSQRLLRIDRWRGKNMELGYGAQWVSITDAFARYVVEKEDWVYKNFRYSLCSDELFIQTLLLNSPFKDKLYDKKRRDSYDGFPAMRYIDWTRGNPYTFTEKDYDLLIHSGMLFARKFDLEKDPVIVSQIVDYVSHKR